MDVYMESLKQFSKKQIYELDDRDVLDFLMFKDVNNSGRSVQVFFKKFSKFYENWSGSQIK